MSKNENILTTEEEVQLTEQEMQEILQSLTKQSEQSDSLVFYTEPLLLTDEEIKEMTSSKDFKNGVEMGYKLTGLYTVLVSSGIDINTINDILLSEFTSVKNESIQKMVNESVKMQVGFMKKQQL